MFGSTRRPGLRGTNSLNMGAYYGYGSDQLIVSPTAAQPTKPKRSWLDYVNPGLDAARAERDAVLASATASSAAKANANAAYQDERTTAMVRIGAGAGLVAFALGLFKLGGHR